MASCKAAASYACHRCLASSEVSAEVHCVQAIQRPLSYAIVDEADSVLIDDCLNPLLMSQPTEDNPKELEERSKLAQQVGRHITTLHNGLFLWYEDSLCIIRTSL